ncbi:hypothetical protein ABKN59_004353 [Abortiporus biennis]
MNESDDDDYFTDNFILDEATLAILDQAESQYVSTHPAKRPVGPSPSQHAPPPAKRRKIDTEPQRVQKVASRPVLPLDDLDEALPDITVQGDGSYMFVGEQQQVQPQMSRSGGIDRSKNVSALNRGAPVNNRNNNGFGHADRTPLGRSVSGPLPPSQRISPKHLVQGHRKPTGIGVPAQRMHAQPGPSRPLSRQHTLPQVAVGSQTPLGSQSQSRETAKLKVQVEIMRVKMEELTKNQADMAKHLREVQDARYAKEGEVSILRNNIEKTAQQHAAEVAKLKAEKEHSDSVQAQIQKQAKEEIERWRTQLAFKQHEMETSMRRVGSTPWSVRSKGQKKPPVPSTPTPMQTASQIPLWNNTGPIAQSSTPRLPAPRFDLGSPPRSQRTQLLPKFKQATRQLPGFQNAFSTVTPPRSKKGKGKQRAVDESGAVDAFKPTERELRFDMRPPTEPPSPLKTPPRGKAKRSGPILQREPSNSMVVDNVFQDRGEASFDMDVDMNTSDPHATETVKADNLDPSDEVSAEIEPVNWREELRRIIFTHTFRSSVATNEILTIQQLMNDNIPTESNSHEEKIALMSSYSSACSRLLSILGSTAFIAPSNVDSTSVNFGTDWENQVRTICDALSQMALLLNSTNSTNKLSLLLNLIRILIIAIPSVPKVILLSSTSLDEGQEPDSPPLILKAICDILTCQLDPSKGYSKQVLEPIANETFTLLEAMCWACPPDAISLLAIIPQDEALLLSITSPSQPVWLVKKAVRAFSALASHGSLSKWFLTLPSDDQSKSIKYIEELCIYLMDGEHESDPEINDLRENILCFFATLATSHPDARPILFYTHSPILAIITYLSNLSIPYWEEEESLVSDPAKVHALLELMTRTVFLLYYLVCTPSEVDLSGKLRAASLTTRFNGMPHLFVMSFGRFSFVEPQDWLDADGKHLFKQISNMSQSILELALDVREVEMVWAAYHPDDPSSRRPMIVDDSPPSDDEREARMRLADDED